ncbi:unnamed protein product, partial [Urochloa decumbens]
MTIYIIKLAATRPSRRSGGRSPRPAAAAPPRLLERGDGGLEVLLAAGDADPAGLVEAELLGGALHELPERRLAEVARRHNEPPGLRADVHGEVPLGHRAGRRRRLAFVDEQGGAQALPVLPPLRLPPVQPPRRPEVTHRHHCLSKSSCSCRQPM